MTGQHPSEPRVFHDNRTWHAVGERCAGFWADLTSKCSKSPELPDPAGMAEILTRLERAETQRDRLRSALELLLEHPAGHAGACGDWTRSVIRAALSDPTQEAELHAYLASRGIEWLGAATTADGLPFEGDPTWDGIIR